MTDIARQIEKEFRLSAVQVENIVKLFAEGATIPFIARYRKEMTGSLDEIELRKIRERYDYLGELGERKATVLKTIGEQGKLTDALRKEIEDCLEKAKLEDLYLPYKPKRKTRATAAREKGLEPLCRTLLALNDPDADLAALAAAYVDADKGVENAEAALKGAADIFAEEVAETAALREYVRGRFLDRGLFVCKVRKEYEGKKTKFEMYYDYSSPVKAIPSHNMLALRRGEKEEVLSFGIEADHEEIASHLVGETVRVGEGPVRVFLAAAVRDAYDRLMRSSLSADVRVQKKDEADLEAIKNFEINLRELLLSPPAGPVAVLGVDPGFRTGCKLAALDGTGKFLEKGVIYPHEPEKDEKGAAVTLLRLIKAHKPEFLAIGNGTASRETERFVKKALDALPAEGRPRPLLVSEAGASVYSASEVASREFPDLDLTFRSAISIGRRFQDPLSELVKIEPKSIGVGQYQHDVDQDLLKKKLDEVTESCVNFVGVDLNTASAELLAYVSGLNRAIAENIVKRRNEQGRFNDRKELLDVPRLGDKAFEQCAGFLRIRGGKNPLDDSAVHPESYYVVEKIAAGAGLPVREIVGNIDALLKLRPADFADGKTGEITVKDILEELKKPGRDPRRRFEYAAFRDDVTEVSHLKPGMILEGSITNVANFGAFVDIGVHQDGLVHVSKLADRFVKDPHQAAKVGQIVKVKVLAVDEALNRISLSMRSEDLAAEGAVLPSKPIPAPAPSDRRPPVKTALRPPGPGATPSPGAPQKKGATLQDLIKKFQG